VYDHKHQFKKLKPPPLPTPPFGEKLSGLPLRAFIFSIIFEKRRKCIFKKKITNWFWKSNKFNGKHLSCNQPTQQLKQYLGIYFSTTQFFFILGQSLISMIMNMGEMEITIKTGGKEFTMDMPKTQINVIGGTLIISNNILGTILWSWYLF